MDDHGFTDNNEWAIFDYVDDAWNDDFDRFAERSQANSNAPTPSYLFYDLSRLTQPPSQDQATVSREARPAESDMGTAPSSVVVDEQNSPPTRTPSRRQGGAAAAAAAASAGQRLTQNEWEDMSTAAPQQLQRQNHFGYFPDHLFGDEGRPNSSQASPAHSNLLSGEMEEDDMAAATRHRSSRPATRMSIVDLTNDSSPAALTPRIPALKRAAPISSADQESTSKRGRQSSPQQDVEEIDLSAVNATPTAAERLRRAQREEALRSQQQATDNELPIKFGKRTCIICMENFTSTTTTICGHAYCHECLDQALRAGEKNNDRGIGGCPVCRQGLSRAPKKKAQSIIPMSFMKKTTYLAKRGKGLDFHFT